MALRRWFASVWVVLVLVIGGCGGDEEDARDILPTPRDSDPPPVEGVELPSPSD